MDKILTAEEKQILISLLELDPQYWGDYGRMQKCYKKKCLQLHPDKGGDGQLMQQLNTLWTKLKDGLYRVRLLLGPSQDNPSTSSTRPGEFFNPATGGYWSYAYGSAGYSETQKKYWEEFFAKWDVSEDDLYCEEELPSSDEESTWHPHSPPSPISIPSDSSEESITITSSRKRKRVHANGSPEIPAPKRACSPLPPGGGDSVRGDTGSNVPRTPARESQGTFGSYFNNTEDLEEISQTQQSYHNTTPKKPPPRVSPDDFPTILRGYLSHAIFSNKTQNAFMIYSTKEKCEVLYEQVDKYNPEYKGLILMKGTEAFVFFISAGKHRVTAVKSYCCKFCTVSFLLCKAVTKPLELYNCVSKQDDFEITKENKPGLYHFEFMDEKKEIKQVDWNFLTSFAVENDLDDPLVIMGHYLEFSNCESSCKKCIEGLPRMKVHWANHSQHLENAELFLHCKQQKSICQQAADNVLARRRLKVLESTRQELLAERLDKLLQQLAEMSTVDKFIYLAGVAWYHCMFTNFHEMLMDILQLFTENIPKKRNVLFRGPVNSGKTSLAAAIMNLVGGAALNVNCPADKLNFELGVAIDKFAVVFEDVKGQTADKKHLQSGLGVNNLDNLRDFLDGSVKVNLEKKHVNKRSQIFPPCIVTANEYFFPKTLFARFHKVYNFTVKQHLSTSLDANNYMGRYRVCQSPLTMLIALLWNVPAENFAASIREKVENEKKMLSDMCNFTTFADMCLNIERGVDPLEGIVVEEETIDE
ncbi:large T antigen [Mastomys natalensis polyomavirus 2]|uniref:Large T antigen n=1 Tax=Mastomys natalensis polyomavirus 2 TaxID=2182467 RepID=A0A2S1CJM2_9POLY|nr:large T antigen [Mastomys natalensis polyomavirus 2]AWD33745.1 large T antigen [Mastomys natalensis polyomavirus 2]AWD33753.1 large T antigen [Mastomys natalensis polyomavirus 2]